MGKLPSDVNFFLGFVTMFVLSVNEIDKFELSPTVYFDEPLPKTPKWCQWCHLVYRMEFSNIISRCNICHLIYTEIRHHTPWWQPWHPVRKSCHNFRVIEINRVVDGDTIDVTIDLGFDLYKKERVRVLVLIHQYQSLGKPLYWWSNWAKR